MFNIQGLYYTRATREHNVCAESSGGSRRLIMELKLHVSLTLSIMQSRFSFIINASMLDEEEVRTPESQVALGFAIDELHSALSVCGYLEDL